MGIPQQWDLGARRHTIQCREAAAIGENQPGRVGPNLCGEKLIQQRAGGSDAADRIPFWPSGSIPKQQLSIEIDAFPIHCGDHTRQGWRAEARQLYGSWRSLAELDPAVHPEASRNECV